MEIALDGREEMPLRSRAAWTLKWVADAAKCERLRDLLVGVPGDSDDDLKGVALLALSQRRLITFEEALKAVDHRPNSHVLSAYSTFVYDEIPRRFELSALPLALRWFQKLWVDANATDVQAESLLGKIISAAWGRADDEQVQEELVALIRSLLKKYAAVPLDRATVDAFPHLRRVVLKRLIQEMGAEVVTGFALHNVEGLVRPEDLEWLLAWHRDESDAELRHRLRSIVVAIQDLSRLDHADALLRACEVDTELERHFRLLEPMRLDDPSVQQLQRRARAQAERAQQNRIDPEVWIQRHLAASSTEPARFHNLLFALTIPPKGGHEGSPFNNALNELPGWVAAGDTRREAIREAATRFLAVIHPRVDDWLGKQAYPTIVLTGTRALMFLAGSLERLCPSLFIVTWVPILGSVMGDVLRLGAMLSVFQARPDTAFLRSPVPGYGRDATGVECSPQDSSVECCLKQHPGEWERCGTGVPSPKPKRSPERQPPVSPPPPRPPQGGDDPKKCQLVGSGGGGTWTTPRTCTYECPPKSGIRICKIVRGYQVPCPDGFRGGPILYSEIKELNDCT